MDSRHDLVRLQLKLLLLDLASKCEHPGRELHELVEQVVDELHGEVQRALKPKLRVVDPPETAE
jgi:hypothetical protein